MPRLVTQKKKRAPKKKSIAQRYGRGRSSQSMTTYTPFFRRMYAARNFTKFRMGFQGYISDAFAINSGYFAIDSSFLEVPFASTNSFQGTQNGSGIYTGGTGVLNYNGYNVTILQFNAWRIHRRRITVSCLPTIQGDQIMLSMYPSSSGNSPGISSNVSAGQPYSKLKMIGFGGEPGVLYNSQSSQELTGMTRAQWDAQPPTAVGVGPAAVLQYFDHIAWATADGSRLGANLVFNVTIEIDVEFSEPKQQVQ